MTSISSLTRPSTKGCTSRSIVCRPISIGEAGQLHQAHQECLSALTLLERIRGGTPVAGYLLFPLFNVYYAWNRLEEASDVLHRLLRIAQDWQQVELLVIAERSAARLALARGMCVWHKRHWKGRKRSLSKRNLPTMFAGWKRPASECGWPRGI